MNSQQSKPRKLSITIDVWEEIAMALSPDLNPSPDREYWSLIAEQERLRLRKLLEHRLVIIGVRQQ